MVKKFSLFLLLFCSVSQTYASLHAGLGGASLACSLIAGIATYKQYKQDNEWSLKNISYKLRQRENSDMITVNAELERQGIPTFHPSGPLYQEYVSRWIDHNHKSIIKGAATLLLFVAGIGLLTH